MAFILLCVFGNTTVFAAIKESDVFLDANWSYVGATSVFQADGWLQALCATEDYLICMENASNTSSAPDTLIAFYKNNYDENGNPVEQFSYAKHITEMDYEHGNGMTYDPVRNEVVIAGGKALQPENTGCIFIVDADTLQFKRKVHVTDEGRVAAIDYWKDTGQYILLIGSDDNVFKFVITDTDFQVLDTIESVDTSAGNTFQDFCISGDYIISIPFMKRTGLADTLQVYSIPEKRLAGTYSLQLEDEDIYVEPESICEIEPGRLLIGSTLKDTSQIAFYTTRVESAFSVTTQVEHGTVTDSQRVVDQGTDFTVKYTPDENYELSSVTVDGEEVDITEYPNEYVFPNLQENHRIHIRFTEIPQFAIETVVHNGSIDAPLLVREGKEGVVHYQPREHYALERILVDGQEAEITGNETGYTFSEVRKAHTIEVFFAEVPVYEITAEAKNGTITPAVGSVYQGEDYVVQYEGKLGCVPAHILIDGEEQEDVTSEELSEYHFQDVQESHRIEVVYQWKYLPLLILAAFWLVAWCVAMQALKLERRRRRIRKTKERAGLQ